MELNIIKKIRTSANYLYLQSYYLESFSLLWIVNEAIFTRACVKALWLRGVHLRDAKNYVVSISSGDPYLRLGVCSGLRVNENSS